MSTATTHINKENVLVPAIRFKEFDGEWYKRKIREILTIGSGKDYKHLEPGNIPVYGTGGLMAKVNTAIHSGKTVFIGRKGSIDKPFYYDGDFWTVDTLFYTHSFQETDPYFVYGLFQKINWYKHNEASGVPSLSKTTIGSLVVDLPSLPEQQKIASFLSAVDEKIQQLTKKKALLADYKKGVMQQLFPSTGSGQRSGQLRFKDANGKAYPDWEDTLLGDCLKYVQPTKYLVSSTEYDNSFETPVLTAGKTFVLGYTDEKENICTDYPLIIFDDFTTASKYVDFPFKAKSSAMKLLLAKEGVDVKFMFEAMQNIKFEVGGHGRHWISIFSQLIVSVPSINEQQKIATYLSRIDTKIEAVNNQITQTQTFKKGLLQQMFV